MPRLRGGATVTFDPVARRTMTAELPSHTDVVQAAGGLVVRRLGGLLEIVLVHRPVQHDWSFPKGKLEPGETLEMAARREVLEETGLTCDLLRFIGHTEYVDRKGRPKAVAYWIMAAEAGSFRPNEEVDELLVPPLPPLLPPQAAATRATTAPTAASPVALYLLIG